MPPVWQLGAPHVFTDFKAVLNLPIGHCVASLLFVRKKQNPDSYSRRHVSRWRHKRCFPTRKRNRCRNRCSKQQVFAACINLTLLYCTFGPNVLIDLSSAARVQHSMRVLQGRFTSGASCTASLRSTSGFHIGGGVMFFDDVKEWSGPFFDTHQLGIRLNFDVDVKKIVVNVKKTGRHHQCEKPL